MRKAPVIGRKPGNSISATVLLVSCRVKTENASTLGTTEAIDRRQPLLQAWELELSCVAPTERD